MRVKPFYGNDKKQKFTENEAIPETIIDAYVQKIIYDHGTFIWILTPGISDTPKFTLTAKKTRKKRLENNKTMCYGNCCTGSDR